MAVPLPVPVNLILFLDTSALLLLIATKKVESPTLLLLAMAVSRSWLKLLLAMVVLLAGPLEMNTPVPPSAVVPLELSMKALKVMEVGWLPSAL